MLPYLGVNSIAAAVWRGLELVGLMTYTFIRLMPSQYHTVRLAHVAFDHHERLSEHVSFYFHLLGPSLTSPLCSSLMLFIHLFALVDSKFQIFFQLGVCTLEIYANAGIKFI